MAMVDISQFAYPAAYNISIGNICTLDAAEEHIAYVIRVPKTGTLLKIGYNVRTSTSPDLTIKVSLETCADSAGAPVATTDAGKTLYAAGAQSAAIVNPGTGIAYAAINGGSPGTGISVTEGDLMSIVIRCTAFTSGSIGIQYDQYNSVVNGYRLASSSIPYYYTYLGTPSPGTSLCWLALEYSDGFYGGLNFMAPMSVSTVAWNSSSNPDRRGLKFRLPYKCRLYGATVYLDEDQDTQVILYDTDEYTVMTGFPYTLDKDKRRTTGAGATYINFTTKPTLVANSWYRLVLLPTTTTPNTTLTIQTFTDDGAVKGNGAAIGSANAIYTTFNGTPTSGSHVWTDDDTIGPCIQVFIDQVDDGAGGGGGGAGSTYNMWQH